MIRIVADTNVIISALVFGGPPRQVFDLGAQGLCEICYSQPIREEASRVLNLKFGWDAAQVESRLKTLFGWFTEVVPELSVSIIEDDPDDDRILECAVAAGAQAIVSGDRHLLALRSFQSIQILTARQFLDGKSWIG